jgi:hypothetical protein
VSRCPRRVFRPIVNNRSPLNANSSATSNGMQKRAAGVSAQWISGGRLVQASCGVGWSPSKLALHLQRRIWGIRVSC